MLKRIKPDKIIGLTLVFLFGIFFTSCQNLRIGTPEKNASPNSTYKSFKSNQNRVALVIGNGAYSDAPLRNPVNDARLMGTILQKADFSVTILENARKNEMVNAIRNFGRSLKNSDAALFYFSGHGSQYKGLNWLMPIGAKVQLESDIEFEGLNAERVLAEMEGGLSKRVNIVIFDACRTNRTFRSFRSYNRGFTFPKVQPEGSIVAFSTAPGTVAYDGDGRYSPYVTELSKHMLTPDLKIEDLFKRVRIGVKNRTSRKPSPQIPWENSALMGDFYFVSSGGEQTPQTSYSKINADVQMWKMIESSQNSTEFEYFLESFPNSQFVPLARIKLKRLKEPKKTEQIAEKKEQDDWIEDPSTGLKWENVSFGKKMTYKKSSEYCKSLNGLAGWNGWWTPSPSQVQSLWESGLIGKKSTFGNIFPKNKIKIVEDEWYWTSHYELKYPNRNIKNYPQSTGYSVAHKYKPNISSRKLKDTDYLRVICVLTPP
jgi:hypothetical protein